MSMGKPLVDRAYAVEKAKRHLTRASEYLDNLADQAPADPADVDRAVELAKAEAATGQGWALLAATPKGPVYRGGPSSDLQSPAAEV